MTQKVTSGAPASAGFATLHATRKGEITLDDFYRLTSWAWRDSFDIGQPLLENSKSREITLPTWTMSSNHLYNEPSSLFTAFDHDSLGSRPIRPHALAVLCPHFDYICFSYIPTDPL